MVAFQSIFYCKRARMAVDKKYMEWGNAPQRPPRPPYGVAGSPVQLLTAMPDAELKLPERSINLSVAKRAGQE